MTENEEGNRILVVDDDPDWCELLRDYLTERGYRVRVAEDGAAMRKVVAREAFDLVLLDLRMPGEDGFSLTTHLRQVSDAGIIIVTGSGKGVDEIVGLELGADDYVAKPCELRHLEARIRAILRRVVGRSAPASVGKEDERLSFQGWTLDIAARRLLSREGEDVALTTAEFDLLATLATRSNRVLSREQLLDLIHGREWTPYDRSIDSLVSQLRHKIEEDPRNPKLIKSVRGVGYVFAGHCHVN